jgi:hypothetical protein
LATTDAIAFLGDTLVSMLADGLSGLVPAANVFLSTPDDVKNSPPGSPSVTVFLYHVAICGEMRNAARRSLSNGAPSRPALPLELRFMITPWTKLPREAYQIIGLISQMFNDHAVLGFGDLAGGADDWSSDDTVEVIMESLPVEEHYDIWETTGLPYRLSLTYLARVVGIDSAASNEAAPVSQANFAKVKP